MSPSRWGECRRIIEAEPGRQMSEHAAESNRAGARPFDGVKILDFTRVLSGPFSTQQLALLGADVIKVEELGGEEMRFGSLHKIWMERGLSPSWMSMNSNKQSVTLDLKQPKAVEIVKRLVRDADVVVENFRPGVMDKLGIGYAALSAINPKLIYCAISGFGQNGPERGTAAFDGMIQAMSGLMSMTGYEETGPTRAGFAACDIITGMTGAFAISSALFQRTHTGQGQFVDVSMLDATLNFLRQQLVEYTVAGHVQKQFGNLSVSRKPTADMFRTKSGFLVLAVLTEPQFARLMKLLGAEHVLADPRFKDWASRIANREPLKDIIETALASADAATWEARIKANDIPGARVWRIDEIANHPQIEHRDLLQGIETPYGPVTLVGPGFRLAHGSAAVTRAPVQPGGSTKDVLHAAGYSDAEISAFEAEKVI